MPDSLLTPFRIVQATLFALQCLYSDECKYAFTRSCKGSCCICQGLIRRAKLCYCSLCPERWWPSQNWHSGAWGHSRRARRGIPFAILWCKCLLGTQHTELSILLSFYISCPLLKIFVITSLNRPLMKRYLIQSAFSWWMIWWMLWIWAVQCK